MQAKTRKQGLKAQSAMEYLMTYGWAILIIAVVLAALFEFGVFNGSNLSPQACIAESGFICKNPVYTANGITFTFGQTTGRDYYGDWIFVAAQGVVLNPNGIPTGFSTNTAVQVGGPSRILIPGQLGQVDFPSNDFQAGGVPSNPTIGTPFAGYVWLGYCLNTCTFPTAYSKVATITIKSTAGFAGPTSTTTTVISTTTTTTSTTSTTTSSSTTSSVTTSVYYVQITLNPSSPISGTFQQMITLNPSSYSSQCGGPCFSSDLGNVRFYSSLMGNVPSGPLDSWLEGCTETACSPSSSQAIFWVNLNGETSGENIYMVFGNTIGTGSEFDGSVAGEAPQISPQYAQYDNGANVFNFYDNFAGTSLNTNKWSSLTSVYSVNNGLQITATPSTTDNNFLESVNSYSVPLIIESYRYATTSNWFGFSFPNTYTSGGVLFYDQNGWSTYQGSSQLSGGSESLDTWYIQTGILAPSGQALENIDYTNIITSGTPYYSGTSGNIYVGDNGGRGTIQWVRTRAYPPNGSMPGASLNFV